LDKQTELRNVDMRFGIWNVRRPYRAGSFMTVAKVTTKCKFHLVGVQEIGWDRDGKKLTGEYTFIY
jgi:hypothetical protein